MSNHKIKYLRSDDPPRHWARCSCRWQSPKFLTQQMVEDHVIKHEELVQRARSALSTRTPSLKHQAQHYRRMAEDPTTPEGDRPIWAQLASELEHRLNATGRDDQPTLI